MNLQQQYEEALEALGYATVEACAPEECEQYAKMEQLPDGIKQSTQNPSVYLKYRKSFSPEELEKIVFIQQMKLSKNVSTLKNCVVFFTVLAVIQLLIGFYFGMEIASYFSY